MEILPDNTLHLGEVLVPIFDSLMIFMLFPFPWEKLCNI